SKTLFERREILAQLVPMNNVIRFSDSIDEAGIDFFKVARLNGLEGIIAKRKDAPYQPSLRTKNWYKIKAEERHEAVICGYTKKRGSSRLFSSLILGRPGENGMDFIGQVGTGFSAAVQKHLFAVMNPLFTETCPFDIKPVTGAPTMWVKPQLVCEVKYTELTSEGVMRHPSFQGLREDKTLADLNVAERMATISADAAPEAPLTPGKKQRAVAKKPYQKENPVLVEMTEEHALVQVEQHDLKFSNIQKFYWTKEKIRKGDLLNYYHAVAPYILPYMINRPQSLNRHPNGIEGENFYHKDMKGKVEPWITTHRRFSESTGENKDFLVCNGEASLLYMANLGCIEMNPWHSRIQSPDYPDWSVIDLDPGENTFNEVIETALVVKKVLDHYHIASHVKTSGSTGLHIYVPFGAQYTYEQSKQFAELIANIVHDELPLLTSLERSPAKRKDKIYLDYLQNRPIQTICAPYSCRPKKDATVSTPLHWDEVKKGLSMSQFTLKNIVGRVRTEGDLFTGVMGPGIDLGKVIQQLSEPAG
ncbi:MAG TPA: DNA ligase D, partial [Flavisolibacter sp.]|nr:DNA ligase D [Flavisolibacter sp.]